MKIIFTSKCLIQNKRNEQFAMERGKKAGIVQINFGAAIDKVNHQRILIKLCSMRIERSMFGLCDTKIDSNIKQVITCKVITCLIFESIFVSHSPITEARKLSVISVCSV